MSQVDMNLTLPCIDYLKNYTSDPRDEVREPLTGSEAALFKQIVQPMTFDELQTLVPKLQSRSLKHIGLMQSNIKKAEARSTHMMYIIAAAVVLMAACVLLIFYPVLPAVMFIAGTGMALSGIASPLALAQSVISWDEATDAMRALSCYRRNIKPLLQKMDRKREELFIDGLRKLDEQNGIPLKLTINTWTGLKLGWSRRD